jgi:hypothetical protein
MDPVFSWSVSSPALAIAVVTGGGIVIAAAVLVLEAQRRRDQRASAFQDKIAEPIARELGATGVSVLPTVRIPILRRATRPAVIRLSGQVPSRDLRDRVVRIVEREAMRLQYFRIEDRLRIAPPAEGDTRRLA